ncbi:type II secretion system protein E [Alicyclobacillus hesperidum subsp. aegles]|uniref:GspE/PulE family protein n=1 Tax=Alicyclobacillus hesperidum TaxID=89784 RepID=UPI000719302B|nr:GspE/PulE family protein [Alicyclobacillus hesperidum]KRW92287.1 type II secretion system protein E [Alicyclobacillus tengchongensis]GLG02061.1 type II secretion system protein E [Alicyclobacillus hesperidum subsp. aegles]
MARKRMGEILVEAGLLTPEQLQKALADQRESQSRLGDVLINNGYISESQLVEVLEFQLGIPHVVLSNMRIDPAVLHLVPERLVESYQVIPYRKSGNRLYVAMADPLDYYAIDDLRMTTNLTIEPSIATRHDIQGAIRKYYHLQETFDEAVRRAQPEPTPAAAEPDPMRSDSPVVRMLNQILVEAAAAGASDVHLDPQADGVRVRYRIDGFLRTERVVPRHLQSALTARVKVLAQLNIAEQRLPQDGRFELEESGYKLDVRVATMPTAHGEKVVMRVFDLSGQTFELQKLDFSREHLAAFERMLARPHGAIFITGPTGSGKTSTLYAALKGLATPEMNVITIEDPIEYQLDGVNQVQVNMAAGLTFARGLRALLRQDPDIVMIGEIRDEETAEIALRAAVTGHLVLSTLHTNDAVSTVTRLLDMGVAPYMIASALTGVVAQRLVRRVCPRCQQPYRPTPMEEKLLAHYGMSHDGLVAGRGCPACGNTGFRGRMAIHEVLEADDETTGLILTAQSADDYRQRLRERGMTTMLEDGLAKAAQGLTTVQEVLRVTAAEGALEFV